MINPAAKAGEGYRPDLDGLRAIAVAAVVAYHLGFPFTSGGYVGVDVFFVLSGFLITRLIASELESGTFTILGFYERRARRIVPALVLVCAVTTIAAVALFLPDELTRYGSCLTSVALSISNVWFFEHAGYFEPQTETQPLLHTWSLGIEEQFYVIFPLLLLIVSRFARPRLGTFIWLTLSVSLLASVALLPAYPLAAFFLLHARAWELLTGSVIALGLIPGPSSSTIRTLSGIAGLLLIAIAVCVYSPDTPFPGLAALIPCLGAALIIWSGDQGNAITRGLSARPLVFLGLISYSLYLWHWPLIVFAKVLNVERLDLYQKIGLIAVSVTLASLTWRFIEQPFRKRGASGFSRPKILWGSFASLATLAVVARSLILLHGMPARFPPSALELAASQDDASQFRDRCHFDGTTRGKFEDTCILGAADVPPKMIVYADSHGAELSAALGALAQTRNESVREITSSACPPAAAFQGPHEQECVRFNAAILAKLVSLPPSTIVVTGHTMAWIVDRPEQYWEGLRTTVRTLAAAGHRVILLGAVPSLPNHLPGPAILARWARGGNAPSDFRFSTDVERMHEADAKLRKIAADAHATYVPIANAFCTADRCSAYLENAVLYFDDNHLSMSGAQLVARRLLAPLIWPQSTLSALGSEHFPN